MKRRLKIFGPLLAGACVQSPSVETQAGAGRFQDVENVAIAPPTGLAPVLVSGRLVIPKMPADLYGRNVESYPVVAYVVDTTGVIEGLAFLNSTPAEFRRSICDWSRIARFEPLHVAGRIRRGLAVSTFGFYQGRSVPIGRFRDEAPEWRSKIQDMSPAELAALLETKPRC